MKSCKLRVWCKSTVWPYCVHCLDARPSGADCSAQNVELHKMTEPWHINTGRSNKYYLYVLTRSWSRNRAYQTQDQAWLQHAHQILGLMEEDSMNCWRSSLCRWWWSCLIDISLEALGMDCMSKDMVTVVCHQRASGAQQPHPVEDHAHQQTEAWDHLLLYNCYNMQHCYRARKHITPSSIPTPTLPQHPHPHLLTHPLYYKLCESW